MTKQIAGGLMMAATLTMSAGPAAGQDLAYPEALARTGLMDRATELHGEHRLDDALDLYLEVVQLEDEAGLLPRRALERVATIHLATGRTLDAARTMDRLAARAEWLGYPDVQAHALLESAALHQRLGARGEARERLRRLEALLGSPHIDPALRRGLESRLPASTLTSLR